MLYVLLEIFYQYNVNDIFMCLYSILRHPCFSKCYDKDRSSDDSKRLNENFINCK